MVSFLDEVAAIRRELGLPPKEEMAAPATIAAAMQLMGVVADESWRLPQMLDAVLHALGLEGFRIVAAMPPAEALEPKNDAQEILVGVSLLYRWPSVGWCVGVIKEANGDRRFKINGEVVNFHVYYEIDDDTSKHVLTLDTYGGSGVGSWVLLEEGQ